ncbi:hypothetical protein EV702DRAFT_971274 [Suillus placidus]|uniref:Gfo/Idh/MocA-like oxidoreductase N-terminal domain-containing protein n=1 Tax=Suillus placidus TaxID=48579 RepID=A0A9P6ZU38_9AGAM|nr:hypothetical protein EV702DRAFT_971274 [Suillus placidus]
MLFHNNSQQLSLCEVAVKNCWLPRNLHCERAMKALATGRHVLFKKPSDITAEETSSTADQCFLRLSTSYNEGLSRRTCHIARFYPAVQCVRAIVESGEPGALKRNPCASKGRNCQ